MSSARVISSEFESLERRQLLTSIVDFPATDPSPVADSTPFILPTKATRTVTEPLLIDRRTQPPGTAPIPVSHATRQAWAAQYNGPGSYWDEVTDFALGDESVYVTGFSYM